MHQNMDKYRTSIEYGIFFVYRYCRIQLDSDIDIRQPALKSRFSHNISNLFRHPFKYVLSKPNFGHHFPTFFLFFMFFVITFASQLNSYLIGGFILNDFSDKPRSRVGVVPSPPPGTCLHFYRAQGSEFLLLLVDFHPMLPNSRSRAFRYLLFNFFTRKSNYDYVGMHSVELERDR